MVYQISIYEIKWISCQWIIHLICSFITTESLFFFLIWCMWQKRIINFFLFYFVIFWIVTSWLIGLVMWCGGGGENLLYLVFCIDFWGGDFKRWSISWNFFICYWFFSWVWDFFFEKIIENKLLMNQTGIGRSFEIGKDWEIQYEI